MTFLLLTTAPDPAGDARAKAQSGWDQIGNWLVEHRALLVFVFVTILVIVILYFLFRSNSPVKGMQRDAMEVTRRHRISTAKLNRRPTIRRVTIAGSNLDAPLQAGKYLGHEHGHEVSWVAFRPGSGLNPFRRVELAFFNPCDIAGSLDSPDFVLQGRDWHMTRDLLMLNVDVHDPDVRERWEASGIPHATRMTAAQFTEEVKRYYVRGLRNDVQLMESFDGVEDNAFLRKEVTRTDNERTETISTPVAKEPHPDSQPVEAGAPHAKQ